MMGDDLGAYGVGAAWINASDRRFKSNIKPLKNALSKLEKIEGTTYFNNLSKTNDIGLIAQDIKEYFPELVKEMVKVDGSFRYGVNYTGFVPVIIESIKEQQKMIKELQEKVDEIDELKEELESLKQLIMNNN